MIENSIDFQAIKELKSFLKLNLSDADHIVEKISDTLVKSMITHPKTNLASFIFSGDSTSGKTFTANLIADFMSEKLGYKKIIFDLSPFVNYNSGMIFTGVEYGYGQSGPGKLTQMIHKNPKTVVILDNFEKAHHNIQNTLIQIAKRGKLVDEFGVLKKSYLENIEKAKVENQGKALDKDDEYSGILQFESENIFDLNKSNYKFAEREDLITHEVDTSEVILIINTRKGDKVYLLHSLQEDLKKNNHEAIKMLFDNIVSEHSISDNTTKGISATLVPTLRSFALIPMFQLGFYDVIKKVSTTTLENVQLLEAKFGIKIELLDLEELMTLLVLSNGPTFEIEQLESKIYDMLFDQITDYLMLDDKLNKVKVFSDPNNKLNLQKLLLSLQDNKRILKAITRRNYVAHTKCLTKKSGKTLHLTFVVSDQFHTVKSIDDIGEDGLVAEVPNVKFKDIAGHTEVKDKLKQFIDIIKNTDIRKKMSKHLTKGVLLYGPPGTGKTMIAKAFASEADMPFIATTANDLLDIDKIKNLFTKARKYAPSIIFIDEIDAFGVRGVGNPNKDIIINKLLTEIDGFSSNAEDIVFVIAATNFPLKLDIALTRAGRIEASVNVSHLNKDARRYMISRFNDNWFDFNVLDLEKIVNWTAGFTGAELNRLERDISLSAFKDNLENLSDEIIREHINIIKYGDRVNSRDLEKNIASTAYHEAGHAIISKVLLPEVKIEQVTVVPRKGSAGFVSYDLESSHLNYDIATIRNKICVALAGRISQIRKFGEKGIDIGATSDLEQATKFIYNAITMYGMDEDIGNLNLASLDGIVNDRYYVAKKLLSDEIGKAIIKWNKELRKITEKLVSQNWDKIEKLAQRLLDVEMVEDQEINNILDY